jgi:hypothetical protein
MSRTTPTKLACARRISEKVAAKYLEAAIRDAQAAAAIDELAAALHGMLRMTPAVDYLTHPACKAARAALAKVNK